jgi:hypothetical protein
MGNVFPSLLFRLLDINEDMGSGSTFEEIDW